MRAAILTLAITFFAASLAADDFKTDAAKAAKAAYEADLKAAQDKYSAALNDAAKVAVEKGELDEVTRIKEVIDKLDGKVVEDDVQKWRQRIVGTSWNWKPLGTVNIKTTFHENRRVEHDPADGPTHFGTWDMLEEHTLVMRRRPEGLWIFFFEDDFKSFKVAMLVPGDYKGTIGTRGR